MRGITRLTTRHFIFDSFHGKMAISPPTHNPRTRYCNRYCQHRLPYQKSGGWVVCRRSFNSTGDLPHTQRFSKNFLLTLSWSSPEKGQMPIMQGTGAARKDSCSGPGGKRGTQVCTHAKGYSKYCKDSVNSANSWTFDDRISSWRSKVEF